MKTIAIYLPQFHEVEENNKWWGKGFTDWVTVKNAQPLYTGHRQPRVPLNQNYYNLLEHDVMEWQVRLAKEYRVFGFCFYHYWFKNGKKILEKPAENLLQWTDIDMPFCFSWANQTWARTWTNLTNMNAWVGSGFEKDREGEGILLKQSYGGKRQWKEHFEYLLPFFRDSRYIRYDGKPIFLIHKPEYMHCLDNMMEYWKQLAVENGLHGLCVITVRKNSDQWQEADYWLMQEFDTTFMRQESVYENGIRKITYEDAWRNVVTRAYAEKGKNNFFGGFVDIDDTPRRGNRGSISMMNASPNIFEKYYAQIVKLAAARKKELVFVNAWNEWGEGAYMEPDEDFQYGYLEAVKRVMDTTDNMESENIILDIDSERQEAVDKGDEQPVDQGYWKLQKYYHLLNLWLKNIENDKRIESVLKELEIGKIAIYGMGDFGKHLAAELKDSSVEIVLCFDKSAEFLYQEKPAEHIKRICPELDAVIVTPILEYRDIRLHLMQFFDVPIMSLEELLAEVEIL